VDYLATFDGDPASPVVWNNAAALFPGIDVQLSMRDQQVNMSSQEAAHGGDCGAPPAFHVINRLEDGVYSCRNHFMTAINSDSGGYGAVYITPNAIADFSDGAVTIRWDVSTQRNGDRTWWDVYVTPWEDNLTVPFESALAGGTDLQGPPRNGIHFEMRDPDSWFRLHVFQNGSKVQTVSRPGNTIEEILEDNGLEPSPMRRDTFEIVLTETHVKFWMPAYGRVLVESDFEEPLNFDSGIVQLGTHDYTSNKSFGCVNNPDCSETASTWHWDNISIDQAIPFVMIYPDDRLLTSNGTVNFDSPAPTGSYLRFTGLGEIDYSLDGGATWQESSTANHPDELDDPDIHGASHWNPIPAGTQTVQFRNADGGSFFAKDFAIWSLNLESAQAEAGTGWFEVDSRSALNAYDFTCELGDAGAGGLSVTAAQDIAQREDPFSVTVTQDVVKREDPVLRPA
jgi:hypothetical protein